MALVLEDLLGRLRAVVEPGESPESLLETTVQQIISQREAARWEEARARAQAELRGPFRPYDPQATHQRYREKYGWTEDSSQLTDEALAARWDASLAELPPEKIAELERLGFL